MKPSISRHFLRQMMLFWVMIAGLGPFPGPAWANPNYWDFPNARVFPLSRHFSGVVSLDADPQRILNNSFCMAARENRLSDLRELLKKGADVNSRADQGYTALMYAARRCSTQGVKLLLAAGAEPNATDMGGRTALMYAAMGTCVSTVEALVKAPGLDFAAKDDQEKTAVDYANESGLLEVRGPAEEIMNVIRTAQRNSKQKNGKNTRAG